MLCHVSVFNLLTSGHVTRARTSGFFNNQKLYYFVHNLQFFYAQFIEFKYKNIENTL